MVGSRAVAPGFYEVVLEAPEIARSAAPGQFIFVRPDAATETTARRAFSLHWAHPDTGSVGLLIQVKGPGTRAIAGRRPGEELQVLGPLGRGFAPGYRGERVALIGGGVGVAPLLFLAERLASRGCAVDVALGFRSAGLALATEELGRLANRLVVVTDDGSNGRTGVATDAFRDLADAGPVHRFCACGPPPMLRSVARFAAARGIPGEVSVEANMACGIGACRGCAILIRDGSTGGSEYRRVCADGPVFPAGEVFWR